MIDYDNVRTQANEYVVFIAIGSLLIVGAAWIYLGPSAAIQEVEIQTEYAEVECDEEVETILEVCNVVGDCRNITITSQFCNSIDGYWNFTREW